MEDIGDGSSGILSGPSCRGLSLIETMIAAAVLFLVVSILLNLLPSSLLAIKRAEQRIQAGNIAQSILEEQRGVRFDSLAAGTPRVFDPVQVAGMSYEPVLEVEDDPEVAGVKKLKVTVRWRQRDRDYSVVRELTLCRVPR